MTRPLAAAVVLALLAPALALARGPSTPAERKRAVQVTRHLERDPFFKGADADREWLFQWIVDIPDIQIRTCPGPLNRLVKDGAPNGRILYAQWPFGMTAFLIEHPDKEKDWVAVQVAGVESVLRAYETVLRKDRRARVPALDTLARAQREKKLADVVKDEMKQCDPEAMGPVPEDSI